jgi:hypothetical protein
MRCIKLKTTGPDNTTDKSIAIEMYSEAYLIYMIYFNELLDFNYIGFSFRDVMQGRLHLCYAT